MAKKRIKELAPHEREILENEFLKEELVQKRLGDAISHHRFQKALDNLGGYEGIAKINQQLRNAGLTPEKAKEMNSEEFAKFMKDHNIKMGENKGELLE